MIHSCMEKHCAKQIVGYTLNNKRIYAIFVTFHAICRGNLMISLIYENSSASGGRSPQDPLPFRFPNTLPMTTPVKIPASALGWEASAHSRLRHPCVMF